MTPSIVARSRFAAHSRCWADRRDSGAHDGARAGEDASRLGVESSGRALRGRPIIRAELGEYSDLVGPAQMQTFAILASIGNQYPDLDRTVAPEPPGAQSPVPFHSVSDMRKALEDCITLLTQSRRLMGVYLRGESYCNWTDDARRPKKLSTRPATT